MAGKNVLFFVHGIGKHDQGWSHNEENGPVNALVKASEYYSDRFPSNDNLNNPITNSLKFVEIRYDDIFEKIRSNWNNLANDLLSNNFPSATPSGVSSIADSISQLTEPEDWSATYALDAFMYGSFPLIRQIVRHSVASQLATGVVANSPDTNIVPEFSIAAHSLGTAVIQDAIQLLGTTEWLKYRGLVDGGIDENELNKYRSEHGNNPFSPRHFKWEALFMIANVAMMFCNPKPDSDKTIVRPGFSTDDGHNAIRYYFNFSHLMDPIPLVAKFSAEATWQRSSLLGTAEDHTTLKHFYEKNIHGLAHYLQHPCVHGRIFRRCVPNRFKDKHVSMADNRVGSSGDFSNIGPALFNDDLREEYQNKLTSVLAEVGRSGKSLDRLRNILKLVGNIV